MQGSDELAVSILNGHTILRTQESVTQSEQISCAHVTAPVILTLSLPECLMEFCKVTLTFESVDKIL